MDVADILTPEPLTIGPGMPPADALQLMQSEDVRHLPVVEEGCLVGIVSDRDLLRDVGWMPGLPPEAPGQRRAATVRELMHADPDTVSPRDTVVTAAVQLSVRKIGCLPVLDGNRLVGIVTEMDLLEAYARGCGEGAIEAALDVPVRELMRRPVHVVDVYATLDEAVERSRALHVRHLPVLQDGRLAGLVSDRDLRAARGAGKPGTTPVSALMAPRPVTIAPDARASKAAERMLRHKFSALPVVEAGALVGMLTLTDLLDQCTETLHEREAAPAPPAGGAGRPRDRADG